MPSIELPSSSANQQPPRLFNICPYYVFDPSRYKQCQFYKAASLPRLINHLYRNHTNWCGCCKKSYHTAKDLEIHSCIGVCHPRAELPVGYLNSAMISEILKGSATAGVNSVEEYRRIYRALFKCEPLGNAYSRSYGPTFTEAYGQLKLEAALRHMTHVIGGLGEPQPSSGQSNSKLLYALLRASSRGFMNPTDAQQQELSRLAMEKVQGRSGSVTLSSSPLLHLFTPSDRDVRLCQAELKDYFATKL